MSSGDLRAISSGYTCEAVLPCQSSSWFALPISFSSLEPWTARIYPTILVVVCSLAKEGMSWRTHPLLRKSWPGSSRPWTRRERYVLREHFAFRPISDKSHPITASRPLTDLEAAPGPIHRCRLDSQPHDRHRGLLPAEPNLTPHRELGRVDTPLGGRRANYPGAAPVLAGAGHVSAVLQLRRRGWADEDCCRSSIWRG